MGGEELAVRQAAWLKVGAGLGGAGAWIGGDGFTAPSTDALERVGEAF